MTDHDEDDDRSLFRLDRSRLDAPPSLPTEAVPALDEPLLSFGLDETGELPHWTEPPTGRVPLGVGRESDDAEPWAPAPLWGDDLRNQVDDFSDLGEGVRSTAADSLEEPRFSDEHEWVFEPTAAAATSVSVEAVIAPVAPVAAASMGGAPVESTDFDEVVPLTSAAPVEPAREAPTGRTTRVESRSTPRREQGSDGSRPSSTVGRPPPKPTPANGSRNMPAAFAIGVALVALFAGFTILGPKYLVGLVAVVMAVGAAEFLDTARRQGYQPVQLLGIVACAALPIVAYWRGPEAITLVLFLALVATLVCFMLSGGLDSNPLPNTALTMLCVSYVGLLGSFGGLLLRGPKIEGVVNHGAGTLWAVVIGVVAYDVGGLLVGRAAGRSTLVDWISPSKTWEGLIFGMAAAFASSFVIYYLLKLKPWDLNLVQAIQLGLVVAICAPLGDLAESMLKRSLGVKDFGNLLPGHGGVLDRFDGLLMVLPAAYYLTRVLNVY